MEKESLKRVLVLACAFFSVIGCAQGQTVRDSLEALLATEYCGTTTMDGMDLSTAILGQSPIAGGGNFNVPEEEWLPLLLEMAAEELEACKRDTEPDIAEIRRLVGIGKRFDNSGDEETISLWSAQKRIKSRRNKLVKMVACLKHARGSTEQVLDMLERIGLESPPEFDIALWVNISMVVKACRDGAFERCLELGRRYRELGGPGNSQEWSLVRQLVHFGIPQLHDKRDRDAGFRYLLDFAGTVEEIRPSQWFDELGQETLPGWAGSLQRRRLAERCLASAETPDGETPAERIQRVCPWAAAELATDESELTDLREVYGDWNGEEDNDN